MTEHQRRALLTMATQQRADALTVLMTVRNFPPAVLRSRDVDTVLHLQRRIVERAQAMTILLREEGQA